MNSEPRVALITGAGSGLGRALARSLARTGVTIAAIDLQMDGLVSLDEELRREGRAFAWEVADVTDARGMEEKARLLEGRLGPIDLLIANAGIGGDTPALGLSADGIAKLVQVNLLGMVNTVAPVLQGMVKRRRGHIVGISSLASLRGLPGMLGYCASKAGVNTFLEGLRLEVKPYCVAVTTICPGWMRTPMNANMREPRPAMMELDVAVHQIMMAIHRRSNFLSFPKTLSLGLGVLRWLPSWLSDWLVMRYIAQPIEQDRLEDFNVPSALLSPLDDNSRLIDLLAEISARSKEEVRCRLWQAETDSGSVVANDICERSVPPYVWSERMEAFYRETDSYLFDLIAYNRNHLKLRMREWICRYLAVRGKPCKILTYGDGLGFDSLYLTLAGHQVTYFEIGDLSRRFAKEIFREADVDLPMLDEANAIDIASFDAILCLDVLEHVPDPSLLIGQLAGWLKPGGDLIVSAPYFAVSKEFPTHLMSNRRYSGSLRLYEEHGLKLVAGRLYHNPIVFGKPPLHQTPGGFLQRTKVRLGGALLGIARYWAAPHLWMGRRMQRVPSPWLSGLQPKEMSV